MNPARHAAASSGPHPRRRDLRAENAAAPSATVTPRHAGSRPRRLLRNVGVALVGLLAFTLTLGGTVYAQLQGDVDAIDVGGLVDPVTDENGSTIPPADPNAGTALNILIIGSDSREDGAISDGFTSVLADTHIIAHISADRSRVELVSIPRDTMVDIPGCKTTSGNVIAPWFGQYNEAFAIGYQQGGDKDTAVACDVNLAQSVTGLTIDGFVLVEMGGFIDMVDALGGVDICIPEAIDVPKANLVLEAGQQTLSGEQALGYARARVGIGDGSDPGRIKRQQHLMSAMVDEVLSRNILTDGPALYEMLRAALSSLTMSSNLSSLSDMAGLALSLRGLSADDVTFMTTPFGAYAPDPNRLVFTAEVDEIWASMAADEPILLPESTEEQTGDEASTAGGDEQAGDPQTDDQQADDADNDSGSETENGSADDSGTEQTQGGEGETTEPAEGGTEGANAADLNPVC